MSGRATLRVTPLYRDTATESERAREQIAGEQGAFRVDGLGSRVQGSPRRFKEKRTRVVYL